MFIILCCLYKYKDPKNNVNGNVKYAVLKTEIRKMYVAGKCDVCLDIKKTKNAGDSVWLFRTRIGIGRLQEMGDFNEEKKSAGDITCNKWGQ